MIETLKELKKFQMDRSESVRFDGIGSIDISIREEYNEEIEDYVIHEPREASLWCFSVEKPGKGYGRKILAAICKQADKSGVTLWLQASPFGNRYLDMSSLVSFYKRQGFEMVNKPCEDLGHRYFPKLKREPVKS